MAPLQRPEPWLRWQPEGGLVRMWTFITQLLVTLVLLSFFLVSCQNVMHIFKGSLCFVLKHIHQELDKELGENEGLNDDEETISTKVVRRRVLFKVIAWQEAGLELEMGVRRPEGQEAWLRVQCRDVLGQGTRTGGVLEEKGQEDLRGQALPSVRADKAQLWDSAGRSHPASILKFHTVRWCRWKGFLTARCCRNAN